ncbi:unnamed protein product [Trichobilharzia szidati]|nr:unnamed protein product [Trichobilharzia szidati]
MWSPEHDVGLEESLTEHELSVLQQFYERMLKCPLEECKSKRYLVRWLRARNWDIDEAETMLCNHVKWRSVNQVDTICDTYKVPEVVQKYFPGGFCGEDKDGYPLYCAPVGRFDPSGFMKATTQTEFIQSRIYFLEYIIHKILYEKSKQYNKCIDQLTLILDMKGLSLRHMHPSWIPVFSEMMTVLEANYPEVLRICYVINAPPIFGTIFNFFKPLLSKTTQEKIHVLKSDYRTALLQVFDPTGLPACYGGKITDPNGDPQCPSRISWGGSVPSSYFRKKLSDDKLSITKQCETSDEVKRVTNCGRVMHMIEVGAASRKDIYIGQVSVHDQINWWVSCEANDIAVGVFMKKSNSKEVTTDSTSSGDQLAEIVPVKRISSNDNIVQGVLQVQTAGIYILSLDNTYSWTKSKRLWYDFTVTTNNGAIVDKNNNNSIPSVPSLEDAEAAAGEEEEDAFNETAHRQASDAFMNDITVLPIPKENYYACRMETGGSMDLNVSILFRFLVQIFILPRIKRFS